MEKIKLLCNSYTIVVHHRPGETDERLVLLHGGGVDNAMLSWREVMELTDKRYDIYAIDMLGYGESDRPDIVYSIPMYVEMFIDILKQLDIKKTNLAGLSLGGAVSLGFSARFPQMVNKLVLLDAWGYVRKFQFHTLCRWYVRSSLNEKSYAYMRKSRKLVRWSLETSIIGDKKKITEELLDEIFTLIKDPDSGMPFISLQRYEMGRGKVTTDLASHLGELKMPVLLVNGEKDAAVPLKTAVNASKVIPDSRLYVMKGCKHWPQKERPEEFVQVLEAFLAE